MIRSGAVVGDYMTRDLTSVSEETTLREVTELLALSRLYGVPVVNDENRIVGFVSEKTIVKSVFPERIDTDNMLITLDKFQQIIKRVGNIGETKVDVFMLRDIIRVKEEDLIADIVDIILNKDISILPVEKENKLVGVITRADICKFLMDSNQL